MKFCLILHKTWLTLDKTTLDHANHNSQQDSHPTNISLIAGRSIAFTKQKIETEFPSVLSNAFKVRRSVHKYDYSDQRPLHQLRTCSHMRQILGPNSSHANPSKSRSSSLKYTLLYKTMSVCLQTLQSVVFYTIGPSKAASLGCHSHFILSVQRHLYYSAENWCSFGHWSISSITSTCQDSWEFHSSALQHISGKHFHHYKDY